MVLSWMMMPRTGGRDFKSTFAIIQRLYERNVAAWEEDNATFTASGKRTTKTTKGTKKTVKKKGAQRLVAGRGKKAVKKRK